MKCTPDGAYQANTRVIKREFGNVTPRTDITITEEHLDETILLEYAIEMIKISGEKYYIDGHWVSNNTQIVHTIV